MKKLSILILFITLTAISYPQKIDDALRLAVPGLGSNARALGMGNSYIALSDDASAAFFNPAGFGLLRRMELSGGLEFVSFNNETDFMGNTESKSTSKTKFDRISFAFPFPTLRGSLVLGLSYHNTKDFNSVLKFSGFNPNSSRMNIMSLDDLYNLYLTDDNHNQSITGNLNQSGDILRTGGIDNWTLSGAVEVYKNLFVGVNLNLISGSYESNNDYYEDDTRNLYQGEAAPGHSQSTDFQYLHYNQLTNWDITGWDAKAGILYQFPKYFRIGATVQFPKTYSVDEKYSDFYESAFGSGSTFNPGTYSDEVKYDITTPFELGAGFSFSYKGVVFSAQGTLIDYTQTEFSNPENFSSDFTPQVNKDIKDLLRAVFNYNLGLEYAIPETGLRVRTGFMVMPSAYDGDPSDFDHKYFTAGIGYLAEDMVGIDLAYAHGWWKDIGDNYGVNVSRTHQTISDNHFILTGTFRF